MRIRTYRVAFLFATLLSASPAAASGDVVDVHVTAIVTEILDDLFDYLDGCVVVGDTITASFTYVRSVPDANPDSTLGRYGGTEPPWGTEASVNDLRFTRRSWMILEVGNDRAGESPGDFVEVKGYGVHATLGDVFIWFHLADESGAALQDDSAPDPIPNAGLWPDQAKMDIIQSGWEWSIHGDIIELSTTPVDIEPTTWGRLKAHFRND